MGRLGNCNQIDGLIQIGVDLMYHNGFSGSKFAQADVLRKLGIEKVFSIMTLVFVLDTAK